MGLLLVFLTSLDKQLIVVGWLPIHGIVALCTAAALLVGVWLALKQHGLQLLISRVIAALKAHPAAPAALMLLSLISVAYGLIMSDVSMRDTLFIASPFVAFCAAIALGSMIDDVTRIHQLLWIAFATVVLSVLVDVVAPGTFAPLKSRAAGWSINPNRGAYLVLLLATTLLNYDRLDLRSLVVLGVTAEAIFLTLSRGGGIVYVLFAAGYVTYLLIPAPLPERIKIVSRTAVLGALFVVLSGLMVLTLPYFDQLGIKSRLGLLEPGPSIWDCSPNQTIGGLSIAQSGGSPASRQAISSTETSSSISTRLQAWIVMQIADLRCERVLRAANALAVVWSSPIVGSGNRSDARSELSSHNMYLSLGIDFGIFGILAYLALVVGSIASFQRSKCYAGAVLIFVTGAWSMFSHNLFDTRPLFLLLGLMIAYAGTTASDEIRAKVGRSPPSTSEGSYA